MDNKVLDQILNSPTTTVPIAGKAVANLSRNAAYLAAARGEIPTVQFGKRKAVPTAWIRKVLMLDEKGQ